MLFSFYLETVANDKEDLERKTTQKCKRKTAKKKERKRERIANKQKNGAEEKKSLEILTTQPEILVKLLLFHL
jgi:hypothetical protein